MLEFRVLGVFLLGLFVVASGLCEREKERLEGASSRFF